MRRLLPLLLLAALPVWAQKSDLQPLPAVPPPPPGMEAFDENLEPQVTIVKKETETREEYRHQRQALHGQGHPGRRQAYYLVDNQGDGQFVEANITHPVVKPPMWIIHSW
jgi:hypothetical protein